jgi:hypothetical protein
MNGGKMDYNLFIKRTKDLYPSEESQEIKEENEVNSKEKK